MNLDTRHLSLMKDFQSRHRAGLMTLLFTDLADSAKLKSELGDVAAGAIIEKHHSCVRELLKTFPAAHVVDTAGDSFFIVFDSPSNAVLFSLRLHHRLRALSKELRQPIQDRIGIHAGEVFFQQNESDTRSTNFTGIHVDTCSRVMSISEPNRTVMTGFVYDNARQTLAGLQHEFGQLTWVTHKFFKFKGVAQPLDIWEVRENGAPPPTPLKGNDKAQPYDTNTTPLVVSIPTVARDTVLSRIAKRRREMFLCAAVACAAMLICISPLFIVRRIEGISYDFACIVKPYFRSITAPPEGVIIYMDKESHDALKQPDTAPWDHAVHAAMVNKLTRADAKAIVFDVLFTTNQPTSGALIKACVDSQRVILPGLEKGHYGDWKIFTPFEELRAVVPCGVVESFSKATPSRRLYTVQSDVPIKTLAELVAEKMNPNSHPSAKGRWLNYYGPPGTIQNYSYVQVLSNDVPENAFRGKAVFIGAYPLEAYTGGRGPSDYVRAYDEFPTPFDRTAPGVELNATAALNLVRGDSLEQVNPYLQFCIFVGVAALVSILVGLLPTGWAALGCVIASIGVAVGGSWLVWQTHQWFSWAVISLVEIPTILLCSIASRTDKLTREKRALEEKVVAQHSEIMTRESQFQSQTARMARDTSKGENAIPDHQLVTQIGKGSYGEVWLAIAITKSFHAVKIVRSKNFSSAEPFKREFEGIQSFAPISRAHHGLVDVLHVGMNEAEGYFFYIMEVADDIVTGREINASNYRPKTLASRIDNKQSLAANEFIRLALQLCDALIFLHGKGLLHRDIKPANVLYVDGHPKLADPGLVTGAKDGAPEVSMIGTIGYMAPDSSASPASDVYSLGKVLYQAAFGRPVAAFPELPTFLMDADNQAYFMGLNDIILKACAHNVRERYASAAELRHDLETLGGTLGLL